MSLGAGDALTALGLVLVIEGLALAVAPDAAKRTLATVLSQPPTILRIAGLAAMGAGVLVVWLVRG
ncbi:MAG: hypothetical protein QOK29_1541 [Rhodospirillaceae bacterium]|nr:hypothetical protein [Rhodospirillaceae bacterium]